MPRRALLVGLLALLVPGLVQAQGRNPKVYYDDAFAFGSQALEQSHTRFFQILTTPAPEDPDGRMAAFWGPQLDTFFENVCTNLHLQPAEILRYLLYPRYFAPLEELVLAGRLHPAAFDSVLQLALDVQADRVVPPAQPLVLVNAKAAPTGTVRTGLPVVPRQPHWAEHPFESSGDTLLVWLPGDTLRTYQRCVLYRTLHDFLATPIGPTLPEGVSGFVPMHDPSLPIVIYASIGEQRLRRTAQHEIAHALVESIAKYLRQLAPARARAAVPDTGCTHGWRPGSGGFSMVTHENYAEYLAFPHGQMEPALRAALIEMVAENRLDGLAALSVGARTQASSYVEGPARLVFLAATFGPEVPKKLLINYHTNSCGLLDWLEEMTGRRLEALEQLYRRWLRETLWGEYLATAVPDTLGTVLAPALSGVQRADSLLLQHVRDSRQELVVRHRDAHGRAHEWRVARDLDGIEHLPLFSSPDLRHGRVAAVVRQRNRESLLLCGGPRRRRLRPLAELGEVREVRDPRWSPNGRNLVFRVVDRGGRNAIALYDEERDRAGLLVPYRWAELGHPSFASDSLVLFTSTATTSGRNDVFALDVSSGDICNLTQSPDIGESEPLRVNGHLVYLSDATGVPRPVEHRADGTTRELLDLPFPVSDLQQSDTLLTLVATSLRHALAPGGRALWGFPLRKLGLDAAPPAAMDAAPAVDAVVAAAPAASGLLDDTRGDSRSVGVALSPYRQKWRLMPFGLSLSTASTRTRGATYVGMDTEFHDQAIIVAVGQNGDLDRFGIVQYRNSAARTYWHAGGYYRSLLGHYYNAGAPTTYTRNQTEAGLLLSAQYHKSLVTRFGAALSLTWKTDARGIVVRSDDLTLREANVPIAGFTLPGLDLRRASLACGGVDDPALLLDHSPAGAARWGEAEKLAAAAAETVFRPTETNARPNAEIGLSYSRDTRVWSDLRGPRTGSLLTATLAPGFNAGGTRTFVGGAQLDSLQQEVGPGLDRVALNLLFLTHRRLAFLDFAFRARAYVNSGPQALVYGVGGLYSVSGFPRGFIRGEEVGYANFEVRAPFWDYSRFRLPAWSPVLPAADGFFYCDAGAVLDARSIYSYGVGLRLRYGMLSFEWRQPLRAGLRNENGFTAAW